MGNKIHTKAKRMLRMQGVHGRNRAVRPKTFKTEESANAYAKENGIKKFELVNLNPNKIKIVQIE